MKVAVVFVLLFATVLCRPARKVSDSDSDSSEEVVRRPAPPAIRRQQLVLSKSRPAPVQNVVAPAKAGSDESEDASDELEEAPVEVKAAVALPTADTASVNSEDSEDDDHDDDTEEEDSETEEEEESDSDSESGESSTPVPVTVTPTPGVVEPETTQEYIMPTIITDPDAGRGDSLGGYPDDYKSIIYVEEKSYHKAPNPYKSYEIVGKKVAYDATHGNEVEKSPKVYKVQAFQIHSDLIEGDTSTPEVETQGLDASSGISQDQEVSPRQAALPEEESASSGASTTSESDSSSTPEEEEEEEGASSPSDSASAESDDEESQSSEEATATPGAADSDSDEDDSVEGDSDEEGAGPENTTDTPVVVTAK